MDQACKTDSDVWILQGDADLACDVVSRLGSSRLNCKGVPHQKGFLISRIACMEYLRRGRIPPADFEFELSLAIRALENTTNSSFAGRDDCTTPLLLTLRVLLPTDESSYMLPNIGLTKIGMEKMANISGNYEAWLITHIRYLKSYGIKVLGVLESTYSDILVKHVAAADEIFMRDRPISTLESIAAEFNEVTFQNSSSEPWRQLLCTIYDAMDSLASNENELIDLTKGLAPSCYWNSGIFVGVTVNTDCGATSGKGVVYSRNPSTGVKQLCGEYYACPVDIGRSQCCDDADNPISMQELFKENIQLYSQCQRVCNSLEERYRDAQTIEFEVENRRLFVVKNWASFRSQEATITIALDFVYDNSITIEEAILRIQPGDVNMMIVRHLIDGPVHQFPEGQQESLDDCRALGFCAVAATGYAVGKLIVFGDAVPTNGEGFILLLRSSKCCNLTEEIALASGYLCLGGGMASPVGCHSRRSGKPMLTGCSSIFNFSESGQLMRNDDNSIASSQIFSIDGNSGAVFTGQNSAMFAVSSGQLDRLNSLLRSTNDYASVSVYSTVDAVADIRKVRTLCGVYGVAVCVEDFLLQSMHHDVFLLFCTLLSRRISVALTEKLGAIEHVIFAHFLQIFSTMLEFGSADLVYLIRLACLPRLDMSSFPNGCLSLFESYSVDSDDLAVPDEEDRGVRLNGAEVLLRLQMSAISQAVLQESSQPTAGRTPSPELPGGGVDFNICVVINSGCECRETPLIFSYVESMLLREVDKYQSGPKINWSVGFVLQVPAACVRITLAVPSLIRLQQKGFGLLVFFDIDKLLPLLLGYASPEEILSNALSDVERSGLLNLLRGTVRDIRNVPGGDMIKFGLMGTTTISSSDLSRLANEIEGNFVIVPLKEAAGVLLSAAQISILKEKGAYAKEE